LYEPCPCGWLNDPQKACGCAPAVVIKYQKRISGPLLDRIDIHIEVPRVDYEKLSGDRLGETSESIRRRVQAARNLQQKTFFKWKFRYHLQCRYARRGDMAVLQAAG
jgi:magnesium chelatase family protein